MVREGNSIPLRTHSSRSTPKWALQHSTAKSRDADLREKWGGPAQPSDYDLASDLRRVAADGAVNPRGHSYRATVAKALLEWGGPRVDPSISGGSLNIGKVLVRRGDSNPHTLTGTRT